MATSPRGRGSRKPARRTRTVPTAPPASQPTIFKASAEEIERHLAAAQPDPELELYFGAELPRLRQLARQAASLQRARAPRPKVLILPGIMGSTLGIRILGPFKDTIWLDPLDTTFGRLKALTLQPPSPKIVALDPFPLVYVGLKLALFVAGFDADYFPYDWRQSLATLGAELKKHLAGLSPGPVHLVAHSMGGLVARAALKQGAKNLGTVVMMGTPNHGSYSPVLALRGVHGLANVLAKLDLTASGLELTEEVFSTFPGLAQMLPMAPIHGGIDWYDPAKWPASPRPRPDVLALGRKASSLLAPPGEHWHLIAGVNQKTVVVAERTSTGFRYRSSFEGDGTVPLASAQTPEVKNRTYYVEHEHGTMPLNLSAQNAAIEILRGQTVTALRSIPPRIKDAPAGFESDEQLARAVRSQSVARTGLEVPAASVGEAARSLRDYLAAPLGLPPESPLNLNAPPSDGAAEFTPSPLVKDVFVSRQSPYYLEINLVHGDIAAVEAEAVVLPKFQNQDFGRSGQAIDAGMDGMLASLAEHRMFSAEVGQLFMIPTMRHKVACDLVSIVGMGSLDGFIKAPGVFAWETLEVVAENMLRMLASMGVSELATLLFSNLAEAGPEVMREGITRLMRGFLRGLFSHRGRHRFRRVMLCESDPKRYETLRHCIWELTRTELFAQVQVRISEEKLDSLPLTFEHRTLQAASAGEYGRDPACLIVRADASPSEIVFDLTYAPSQNRAAIPRELQRVPRQKLEDVLQLVKVGSIDARVTAAQVRRAGEELADLLLTPELQQAMLDDGDAPLIIVHDSEASRIPWETLAFGPGDGRKPACVGGLSRQYAVSLTGSIIAKWAEGRRTQQDLHLLLVVNPTEDLPGAAAEGDRIRRLFQSRRNVTLHELRGAEATKPRLLEQLSSGKFDALHYAGHAFFDPVNRQRSGLICASAGEGTEPVLTGADLAGLGQFPPLVFLNACESARVRGGGPGETAQGTAANRIEGLAGVAEAFLKGGVANFIGTYWPVGDDSAELFAETLYSKLLEHLPLGPAITQARGKILQTGSGDWADYVFYGNPNYRMKLPPP